MGFSAPGGTENFERNKRFAELELIWRTRRRVVAGTGGTTWTVSGVGRGAEERGQAVTGNCFWSCTLCHTCGSVFSIPSARLSPVVQSTIRSSVFSFVSPDEPTRLGNFHGHISFIYRHESPAIPLHATNEIRRLTPVCPTKTTRVSDPRAIVSAHAVGIRESRRLFGRNHHKGFSKTSRTILVCIYIYVVWERPWLSIYPVNTRLWTVYL